MPIVAPKIDVPVDRQNTHPETVAQADRANNTRRAYSEIRRRILSGEMPPGSQYLEQELAEMLGMSRTPVRESLIRLADERLVEVKPRHGARILSISTSDIHEIYELVAELEALAARRLAAQAATADHLAALESSIVAMQTALVAGDRMAWFEADRTFHAIIVGACGNARLISVVEGLLAQAHWARQCTIDHYVIGERSAREHAEIVAAIRSRNAATAAGLVHYHRVQGGRALAELLTGSQTGR